MGLVIGPSKSHSSYVDWPNTALGSTVYGGRLFCKSGGTAWIVALSSTQVSAQWNGGSGSTFAGSKPCVSNWPTLNTALTNAGLTPSQWFVPSIGQLQSGYACRTYWDSFNFAGYWSSTDSTNYSACNVWFNGAGLDTNTKGSVMCVRAFRCVTY